jgi:hypothetical protein
MGFATNVAPVLLASSIVWLSTTSGWLTTIIALQDLVGGEEQEQVRKRDQHESPLALVHVCSDEALEAACEAFGLDGHHQGQPGTSRPITAPSDDNSMRRAAKVAIIAAIATSGNTAGCRRGGRRPRG